MMKNRIYIGAALIACMLLIASAAQVSAGGPVCRTPQCMPPMACPPPVCAAPMPCPPPMCAPPCPPPRCGPPACGPRPCGQCKENPLAMILEGACKIVVGAVSLPFKLVDCLLEDGCRPPCPPPGGPCMIAAAPCPPPVCAPPMCGPGYGPGMGYGMGPGRPVGFGRGAPKKFSPFAQKTSAACYLLAGPPEGIFGSYW
jgi:hypothetical protein